MEGHYPNDSSHLKRRDMDVNKLFVEFATSIQIVSHVIKSRSLGARVFWSAICFCALGIIFWQVSILLQHYYSYPKKVR